jgi:seryl-tRNA synthetase
MYDIRAIRDDKDAWVKALSRRPAYAGGKAAALAEDILKRDENLRLLQTSMQQAQASRNSFSKDIGRAKAAGDETKANELLQRVAFEKETIRLAEQNEREGKRELEEILAGIPNLPAAAPDVPDGEDESANTPIERRYWKNVQKTPAEELNENAKEHFDLGEALGMMDFERAAKVSGARFVYLMRGLARMERALASFMLDLHTDTFGYTEVNPPLLVRDGAFFGTGQLPKFEEDLFFTDPIPSELRRETFETLKMFASKSSTEDARKLTKTAVDIAAEFEALASMVRYGLIPTSEVSLTNYVNNEIVDEGALPIRFTAHTPCFRAEAGAAGRDTRGMIRMHQFSKVELVSITTPEQSNAEHERMTDCAQEVLKRLGLHHRVVALCTGDMGFSARKTYDIEVWLPGQGRFREISSCSNCGDFQGRRMNARYRGADGKSKGFVHTLNGSGLAVGRTLIAIMENYQEPDGSIRVPDVLVPYMGGMTKIEKVGT